MPGTTARKITEKASLFLNISIYLDTSGRERANGAYHRDTGRHCESRRERNVMDKVNGRERHEVRGIRHTRLPWQLRAAGAAVGAVAGTLLLMQAIPVVSYGMLVLADGIRVALGWGSVL